LGLGFTFKYKKNQPNTVSFLTIIWSSIRWKITSVRRPFFYYWMR